MENNNAHIIQEQIDALEIQNLIMMKEIGELNKKAVEKAFNSKSFDGKQWEEAEEPKNELLVKTGKLKNSVRISSITKDSVTISSDVPYAKFHNEGTNKLPKRQFMGQSIMVDTLVIKLIMDKIKKVFK